MDASAIALRLGNYAILSLIAGAPLFLWLACGAGRGRQILFEWRIAFAALILLAIALTIAAFLSMVAGMTGEPPFPVDWDVAWIVLSATAAGKAMLARSILLALMLPLAIRRSFVPMASLGMLAIATLAWTGHAAAGEGASGIAHLAADMIHLAAAATWIGGMACLLATLHRSDPEMARPILRAFAPIGSAAVGLLVATGVVNSLMIVGFDQILILIDTFYGKLLAMKLLAFGAMLMLAANNRFRLTPLYDREPSEAVSLLRKAVGVELAIAAIILFLVGWLGMVDPTL